MKYSIIIPCYNEEGNLKNLIKKISILTNRGNVEIILVENGSKDNSKNVLKKLKLGNNIKIVYVKINKGYGYGLLQGLKKAKGTYVGWIHADLQIAPGELIQFMDYIDSNNSNVKYFLKGRRKNRKLIERFFTFGMTIYESVLFRTYMYDIMAMPVFFHRDLLNYFDKAPYDFSLDIFVYYQAKLNRFVVKKFPVFVEKRENGKSSWNSGIKSRIKQSIVIMKNSVKIKKGEKII